MKKIITAIGNPKLNEELKKENNFEIIGKDLQYKEAILEILEENKKIDLIIMSENLLGNISFENLFEKINLINEKIKIIFILEKENNELKNILRKNNINEIYYKNKINLIELKKIINKKENINYEKIINKKENNNYKEIKRKNKIITFSGNAKSGKTTLTLIIGQYLSNLNYKILLVDGDFEKHDLNSILKKDLKIINKKIKIESKIKIYKVKKLKIKKFNSKNKINILKINKKINLFTQKINNNFYIFPELNQIIRKYTINTILQILEEKYDFVIFDLSKYNFGLINEKILKKANQNFLVTDSNLLGVKEIRRLLKLYCEKWKISEKSLHIIQNRYSCGYINREITSKVLSVKNEIFLIREDKKFNFFIDKFFKRNILLKNKNIKKDLKKIIKIFL